MRWSNAHGGREFEEAARLYFKETGVVLQRNFDVPVGFRTKKLKRFDLGSEDSPMIVECKSFTWTETGKSPSAKMYALNDVMLVFSAAPQRGHILPHSWSSGTTVYSLQGSLIPVIFERSEGTAGCPTTRRLAEVKVIDNPVCRVHSSALIVAPRPFSRTKYSSTRRTFPSPAR